MRIKSLKIKVKNERSLLRKLLFNNGEFTPYRNPRNTGFTVVELIVAMGLFMTIIVVAVGAYIQVIKTQGIVTDVMAANDNASLVMEQMAREIRTGKKFIASNNSELTFLNDTKNCVLYKFIGDGIARKEVPGLDGLRREKRCETLEYGQMEPLTAPTVVIKEGSFLIKSEQSQGRRIVFDKVDISFKVDISRERESSFFAGGGNQLKTTVSARKYFQN